ncbi:wax ester/triacylglycerol synthase family O-acyltransferase [Pseudohalioglobus sediminis]|nr:wax ester/triacylglycerol synthase family O-acyltransferase [Pseudohalioglobus sediminis]
MKTTRIKPLDAVWLMMETSDTPMHMGVLSVFQKPRNCGAKYFVQLAEQMRSVQPVAPWNYRLAKGIGYRTVVDEDFDIDYHFRRSALPEPGGERELGQMISRLHSSALDLGRPLWEVHLIEGLERDRFALYIKMHHALVEGVNGVPALLATLSHSARSRSVEPLWAQPPVNRDQHEDIAENLQWPGLAESIDSAAAMGRAALGLLSGALRPSERNSFLLPRGTPRSTLNRRINAQRRFATQQFDQQRIEAVADATDSTVNEILTYLCGSSLRRFFKEYNALPDESLVGMIPVSLQERGQHLAGNAIAGLRMPLGTHIADPLKRLQCVKKTMKEVRRDRASLPEESVTSYVLLRAAPIYASQIEKLGQFVPPLYNLAVSNTAGAEKTCYYNGARLEAVYPLNPLLQFSALSIDCVSYAGTLNVGFTGARDTLPHLQRMAVYLGKALADLEELVAKGEAA